MERNYRVSVFPITCEDGSIQWGAEFPDVPNVGGGGDTPEEAVAEAYENLAIYLKDIKDTKPLPVPTNPNMSEYSGRFLLRLSRTLHRDVALRAEEEGVSINSFINEAIAKQVGERGALAVRTSLPAIKFEQNVTNNNVFVLGHDREARYGKRSF